MLSGIIGTAGTAVNTAGSNLSIDSDASFAATSGTNIAIGTEAMGGGSLGDCDNNIAVGTTALTNLTTGDYNIAIGSSACEALKSNNANIGIGYKALTSIDSGEHYNIAIGHEAMKNVDDADADYNIAIGFQALEGGGDTKAHNIAIGVLALDSSASAVSNVIAIGSEVMRGDMTGGAANNTVGIGYLALNALTTGAGNVAVGMSAGKAITSGSSNTFVGAYCGDDLQTSNQNTAMGYAALGAVAGGNNTAMGYGAGQGNTGADNTFLGYQAGDVNTGSYNVVVGSGALGGATSVDKTVAIGNQALFSANDDSANGTVAIGWAAGYYSVPTGTAATAGNTIIGYSAGTDTGTDTGLTTGIQTTVVGHQALGSNGGANITGNDNTVMGYRAGYEINSSAHSNTFIGSQAGNTTTTGTENTIVGYNCEAQDGTATNQVVIGNNVTGTADNAVHIGNDSNHLYTAFSSDSWSATSDIRQKKNIKDDTLGLEFIKSLKTKTYSHKSPSEFPKEWRAYNPDDKEPMDGNKVFHSLIAQEVKQSLDDINCTTFDGWSVDSDGRQRISRTSFITPLIKAVQELSQQIEDLKKG
mgnify:CR=1 FL=1